MDQSGTNVPAALAAGILGLAVGVGLGIVGMAYFGHYRYTDENGAVANPPPGPPANPMGGPPGGKGMMGMMGPNPKTQLASLITKLDVVTEKPIVVKLSDEQKAKVREQIKDLADKEELTDDEARQRLDALIDVVRDDRAALEAVGFRFPAEGNAFTPPTPPLPNPFKAAANGKHLEALRERVAK